MSGATPEETMDLEMLDGFLVGLAIGPEGTPAELWLPEVFGGEVPDDLPDDIRDLILRQAEEVESHFTTAARSAGRRAVLLPADPQDENDDGWQDSLGQYFWAGVFAPPSCCARKTGSTQWTPTRSFPIWSATS